MEHRVCYFSPANPVPPSHFVIRPLSVTVKTSSSFATSPFFIIVIIITVIANITIAFIMYDILSYKILLVSLSILFSWILFRQLKAFNEGFIDCSSHFIRKILILYFLFTFFFGGSNEWVEYLRFSIFHKLTIFANSGFCAHTHTDRSFKRGVYSGVWFGRFLSKEGLIDWSCQKRGLFLASLSVHQRRNSAGVKLRGGQRDDSAICVDTCRDFCRAL